jgi:hypothetical protein
MISLCIGAWQFNIECTPAEMNDAVARRYAPFVVAPRAECHLVVEAEFLPAASIDTRQQGLLNARVVPFADDYLLDEPEINGTISLIRQRASLRLSSSEPLRDLEYFLRIVVALFAYEQGGLLIHGAALAVGDWAHVFIGRSGSGKSTVVALSPHAAALGDDLVLLRQDAGGWVVHGTPFWNWQAGDRSGQTLHARLRGIYKLVQSDQVRLSPLSAGAATAELMVNCPIVNGVEALIPGLVTVCRQLALATPVQSLHFRKDATFWRLLEREKATV